MDRFGETTGLCRQIGCKLKKHCIHFLALIERRKNLKGDENYLSECEKMLIDLPHSDYSTDCLFSSVEGRCYKHHRMICEMECNKCTDYYKRTYDKPKDDETILD